MARRHHSPTDNDQLGLALTGEGFQGPAEPHGLLSGAYLARHLRESSQFASSAETISDVETPGWFPSQQIQDYLIHAKDETGRRFFNWAILTNGCEWRLYCEHAAVGAFFAFHLARDGQMCSEEEFRLFFTLFRARAFERAEDTHCFLDDVREQSLRVQADLETNLRKRIFGVLEDLGSAFVNFDENRLTAADFPAVYENALIFLYRLLFILYAESWGLLPVRLFGPGANRRYLNEFSLARLTGLLRDRSHYRDNAAGGRPMGLWLKAARNDVRCEHSIRLIQVRECDISNGQDLLKQVDELYSEEEVRGNHG